MEKSGATAPSGPAAGAPEQAEPVFKHTPGPWFVFEDFDPEDFDDDSEADFGRECTIAQRREGCVTSGVVVTGVDYETERHRANARLIAAAPDLLEALRELLPLFDMVTGLDDQGSNALGQAENLIRAAIAKATGGNQQ